MRLPWLWAFLVAMIPGLLNTANAQNFQDGVAYQSIVPEQPTSSPDKIEVLELFWYGCPHCHRFEPYIERWLKTKPANVEFVRMPAVFNEGWEIHARAYYTAEVLGALDKIHDPLFRAIHSQKRKLNTEEALQAFFVEQGVSADNFSKTFRSFAVDAKVRRAKEMGQRYGVRGTPAIVVNGKYWTDGTLAQGGPAEMLKVTDFLVKKETR